MGRKETKREKNHQKEKEVNMLSFWIYDLQASSKIPCMKFSPIYSESIASERVLPVKALENLKGFIKQAKKHPYRFKVTLKAECPVTLRMVDNMDVMHNFSKALLFFHEESTDRNEYLKLFGAFCAMVTSEGATVND